MVGKIVRSMFAVWFFLATMPSIAGNWSIESSVDPTSYQAVSLLRQESINSISDEYGAKEVKPRLEFRCFPNTAGAVHVRINWLRFISSFNTEITFVAEDREPLTVKMGVDRSNKITMTRNAKDDEAILASLTDQQKLKVRVTPYSEAPLEVQFDLADLDAGLALLSKACDAAS